MRAKLFKLCLEQLGLIIGDGLLVKNQDLRDVVVVDLFPCK